MGLLTKVVTHVVLAPVTGPIYGLRFVLSTLRQQVESELRDEEKRLQEELVALNMRLELGELSEAEFVSQEASLLSKLRAFREGRAGQG